MENEIGETPILVFVRGYSKLPGEEIPLAVHRWENDSQHMAGLIVLVPSVYRMIDPDFEDWTQRVLLPLLGVSELESIALGEFHENGEYWEVFVRPNRN